MSDRPDKPLIMVPGPAAGTLGNAIVHERRTSPRFPFTATGEIFDIASKSHVTGRSSDLSSEGCYIDTINPFAMGALVHVSLERGGQKFQAKAIVKYSHPSMGMGIAFTESNPEHQITLQKWIAELRGEVLPETEVFETVRQAGMAPEEGNLRQVLNEMINLMIRKKIISDKEGTELLRLMFR